MTASQTPDSPRYGTPVQGYLVVKDGRATWYPTSEVAELNAGEGGLVYVGPESLGPWIDRLGLRPHRPLKTEPAMAPWLTDLRSRFEQQAP